MLYLSINLNQNIMDTYNTSHISRTNLQLVMNILENNEISYHMEGEEIIFDMTELSLENQKKVCGLL